MRARRTHLHRALTALIGLALITQVSCSTSDNSISSDDAPDAGTGADPAAENEPADADSTAGSTAAPGDEAAPTSTIAEAVGDLVRVTDVVDESAELRCDMLGYPCGWDDAPSDAMSASFELLEATRDIMAAADNPWDAIAAAAESLAANPDVVEVMPDTEGFTGIQFRLAGAPPVFLDTELAGPITDDTDRERVALPEGAAPDAAPVGFRSPVPERYHPVGGPLKNQTAVVIDPYATVDTDCDDTSWEGLGELLDFESPIKFRECRQTGDGTSEGSAIAAIFRSKPEHFTTVTHITDGAATPGAVTAALASADVVHIATHGSSNCRNAQPTGDLQPSFQLSGYDPSLCYSLMALGLLSPAEKNAARTGTLTAPAGVSFSNTRWWVTGDYIAAVVGKDSIVYASHCTSGDGQLAAAGFAGFVGWHSYARISSAVDAAVRFWGLMATDGVEFDLAYSILQDENLHRSAPANVYEHLALTGAALLVAGGTNPRARDVITAKLDGADWEGQTLRVSGKPGDTESERFPHKDQELTFEVEGVKVGTPANVTIDVYRDGKKLKADLNLAQDGQITTNGEHFNDWTITVKPDAIEFGPTTAADFAPNATTKLEVRAYERSNVYTADEGTVRLGARLAAVGPLPIFDELASTIGGAGGTVEGNELRIEFDTTGGEVEGDMRVAMMRGDLELGFWEFELAGNYDPNSGTVSGPLQGRSEGGWGPVSASDSGSGTWEGTVNLDSGQLVATLGAAGETQAFVGTIEAVG